MKTDNTDIHKLMQMEEDRLKGILPTSRPPTWEQLKRKAGKPGKAGNKLRRRMARYHKARAR
jgi:hypothetical protein